MVSSFHGEERWKYEAIFNLISDSSTTELDLACERKDLKGKEPEQRTMLHDLEPLAIQALHALVSLVHNRISIADCGELVQSESTSDSAVSVEVECKKPVTTNSFSLEDDPVAKILWNLDPCTLQNVFLAMAVSLLPIYFCIQLKSCNI